MTARITQQVSPRHRSDFRSALRWAIPGKSTITHTVASRRTTSPWGQRRPLRRFQQGSISPGTITLSLGLMALITVALLGFFYLQQVVRTASQGTDVHALESEIANLREQQRQLELDGASLRSLNTIEDHVQKLNLVTTDKVSYLAAPSDKVAANITGLTQ